MSASREKKARQEFAASGAVDPKAARQAEERAKQRRNNWLYGGIAIVFGEFVERPASFVKELL